MKKLTQLLNSFKRMLFPPHIKCVFCSSELSEKDKHLTCEKCFNTLPFNTGKVCTRCGHPVFGVAQYCIDCKGTPCDYEHARAPFLYEGQIKSILYKLKYSGAQYLSYALSAYLANEYIINNFSCDACIPVPLCNKRLKERGYNQAYLLARDFCNNIKIPLLSSTLIRIKDTPSQTQSSGRERAENMKGAFKVENKLSIKGKSILLIDDVYTSGATAMECASVLKRAGAKFVYVLCVAHTKKKIVYDAQITQKIDL